MGDSDDDYNNHHHQGNGGLSNPSNISNNSSIKKNRDKFYRERDDSANNNNNSYNRNSDSRREWSNDRSRSDSWKSNRGLQSSSGSYSGGNPGGFQSRMPSSDYPKKYTHQSSPGNAAYESSPPPYKRNKKEWTEPEFPTQPPFLSFKLFLQQQDDNISDEEAIKKYNEYKLDFKKTQINNFFLEHKEEEWFKSRYHPDECHKRRNEQNQFVLNRLEVFMELMKAGWLDEVAVENDKSRELIKFLDAVVIKLEGGTDLELKSLTSNGVTEDTDVQEIKPSKKEESEDKMDDETNGGDDIDEPSGKKRKSEEDSGSESGAYTDSDDEEENGGNVERKKKKRKEAPHKVQLHKTASIFMRNLAPSVTKQDLENLCKSYDGYKRVALSDPAPERGFFRRGWITFEPHVDVKKICWNLQNIKVKDHNPGAIVNRELTNRIRPLTNLVTHHKAVVKNDLKIAMKIIENMDKKWNLWSDNLKEESVTDEAKTEVEVPSGEKSQENEGDIAALEKIAFNALPPYGPKFISHKFQGTNPLLKNITDYLVEEMNAEEEELLGDGSKSISNTVQSGNFDIEIDQSHIKALDKLVLYLRVVHSIDFYNSIEYQQEDSMPNRCGIMFVRPAVPPNAALASLKTNQEEINQYIQQFEAKMKPYMDYKDKLDIETSKKLGIKDRKEEVEKFIKTNTQELAQDRWLCPLSGKKFKGPEFIRKHLFYKHMDKLNDVKKEVEYYNNYVMDPKRPQLPEHPSNKSNAQSQQSSGQSGLYSGQISNQNTMGTGGLLGSPMMAGQMGFNSMQGRGMSGGWQSGAGYMSDMIQSSGPGYGYGSGYSAGAQPNSQYQAYKKPGYGYTGANRRGEQRERVQYKDLDAPEEN